MTPEENRARHAHYQREYAARNREKIKAKAAKYRAENKEKAAESFKKWAEKNKEVLRAKAKAAYAVRMQDPAERQKARDAYRKWYHSDREDGVPPVREHIRRSRKERYASDDNYRLRQRVHSDMWKITRGVIRRGFVFDLIGCTLEELSAHIAEQFTEGMDFDNHGDWEVDHIRPLSAFDLTDEAQLAEACHFSNLQPLWKEDNRAKAAQR